MKKICFILSMIATLFLVSCHNSDDLFTTDVTPQLVSVSIDDIETRIDVDNGYKMTWSAKDELGVYDAAGKYAGALRIKSGDGTKSAIFEVIEGSSINFDGTNTYKVVYPHMSDRKDFISYQSALFGRYQSQDATGTGSLGSLIHLSGAAKTATVSLQNINALMIVKLTKPTEVTAPEETPSKLVYQDKGTGKFYESAVSTWADIRHLVIEATGTITASRDLRFSIQTNKGRVFNYERSTSKGHQSGYYYTADLKEITPSFYAANEMKYTIRVKAGAIVLAPFIQSGVLSCDISINWGDGPSKSYASGTAVAEIKHTYVTAGTYQVTLASTQLDFNKKQVPDIALNNIDLYGDLISLDSPLLRAGTFLKSSFQGNVNLQTIHEDLFIYNSQVTSFQSTFQNCSSLTAIPATLFANNVVANTFLSTFEGCSSLKEIPNGLFVNNLNVNNFQKTFFKCDNAKLNPNIFCDESVSSAKDNRFKGKAINFINCFAREGATYVGVKGTAPQVWSYAGTSTKFTTCFGKHSEETISNFADIPAGWK